MKDDSSVTNDSNPGNVTTNESRSFKYKSRILGKPAACDNGVLKNAEIAVPLKYISNLWQSLETNLINFNIYLELSWTKNCVMSSIAENTGLKITNTNQYVYLVNWRQSKIDQATEWKIRLLELVQDGNKNKGNGWQ